MYNNILLSVERPFSKRSTYIILQITSDRLYFLMRNVSNKKE